MDIEGICPHCKKVLILSRPTTQVEILSACVKGVQNDSVMGCLPIEQQTSLAITLFIQTSKKY